jgi:hypothetical protein
VALAYSAILDNAAMLLLLGEFLLRTKDQSSNWALSAKVRCVLFVSFAVRRGSILPTFSMSSKAVLGVELGLLPRRFLDYH